MRWQDSLFFQAKSVERDIIQFDAYAGTETKAGTKPELEALSGESMLLGFEGDKALTEFTSNGLANEAKKHHIYFFYLCNPKGIKQKGFADFSISLYKGCYYRSTPFYEFKQSEDKTWALDTVNPDFKEIVNKDESFAFNSIEDNLEKVYMMNLDHEKKETMLWYYSVTEEDKKVKGFRPKLFEKSVPLLSNRPKLGREDRARLIERFDGWIIMS